MGTFYTDTAGWDSGMGCMVLDNGDGVSGDSPLRRFTKYNSIYRSRDGSRLSGMGRRKSSP